MHYSNAGFIVLGLIIEKVSGMDYYHYVKQNIYQKAGMKASGSFKIDQVTPRVAVGYIKDLVSGTFRNNYLYRKWRGSSAGGGFSTVGDLHKFVQALKNHQLLSKKFTDLIFTEHISGTSYGYGMMIYEVLGEPFVGHNGGFPGVSASVRIYNQLGYDVIVLSNYDPPTADFISNQILKIIRQETVSNWLVEHSQWQHRYTGWYKIVDGNWKGDEIQVLGNQLVIIANNHTKGIGGKFVALSANKFIDMETEDIHLSFSENYLSIDLNGKVMRAKRVQKKN